MANSVIKKQNDPRLYLEPTGYIDLRDLSSNIVHLDVFDSYGNGIVLGFSQNGISATRVIDGTNETIFINH